MQLRVIHLWKQKSSNSGSYVFWFLSVPCPVYGVEDPLRTKVKPELPKAQKGRYFFWPFCMQKIQQNSEPVFDPRDPVCSVCTC